VGILDITVESVFLRDFDPIKVCSTTLDLVYQPITFSGKLSLKIETSNDFNKIIVFSQDGDILPTLRTGLKVNLKLRSTSPI
jgi:hypothetical protein